MYCHTSTHITDAFDSFGLISLEVLPKKIKSTNPEEQRVKIVVFKVY